ncbi:uncharacterized protein LOC111705725 [Eurytemora carolleeae]|uniref:uncharacterized protein LOC111705725 n=1 Tax=Eurytemora carolleeae TaxID=1294199 RepID=UPI000C76914F|nr:uncharacterized protein LOC111705725 [Eurytemora carolleeae]|eukprot:XP_023334140.1 uncharacterized protein LOC111705725 [Eurytemora affinis]
MFDELGIGQILCMSSWITTVAAAVSILTGHFLSTSSGKLDPYFNQKLYQVSSKEYLQSEVLCIPILLLVNILPLVLLHQVLYAVYILCSKSQRYGGNSESNFTEHYPS